MKLARSLIMTLSFLLWFSFTTTKPLSFTSVSEQVNDVNGDPIIPGQEYYIMSAIWEAGGGGVRPGKTGDASCANSIVQESSDLKRGVPVKFHIPGKSTDTISPGSTHLEIEFVEKPDCAESSKWVVAYASGSSLSSSRLVIGGPEDHPDAEMVSGVFQIEVYNAFAYKLVFCPKSNFRSSGICYDIGIDYEGNRQLVVKRSEKNTFMVAFVKASDKGMFIT